jgi:hypothetical protein
MGFLKKLLGSQEEELPVEKDGKVNKEEVDNFKKIGESDKCPYCKKVLEKIPKRKSKCPHCEEYMYSRTRPSDRKKVLVTEKQRDEIEEQWARHYEIQEESNLMENSEFVSAKKELTKQFGKEPDINDVKWRVYNQKIIEYASNRQWGLYRNNKLDMAFLLQKEDKLKPSLNTLFEVAYLDINGCNNIGTYNGKAFSKKEMEEYGMKEFDPKREFMAPGVIAPIQNLISELQLSEKQARELFISITKRTKPVKEMPISEEVAWDKLQKDIEIRKSNDKKIEKFDTKDIDEVIKLIKNEAENKDVLTPIIYDFRNHYKTKKTIEPNVDKIKKVVKELLSSSEKNKNLGVSLLLFFVKKDKSLFELLAKDYIRQNKKHFQNCPEEHTIGELGKINPEWIEDLIPSMIKALKQNPEWNTRRFMAFNLGSIGSKNPELVKETIPIMVDYIKKPIEVAKRKPTQIEAKGVTIEISLSSGIDQTQWLKDAYIDALGMIAKGDRDLIEPHRKLFEKIVKKDKNEYSQKKAQKVLDILNQ